MKFLRWFFLSPLVAKSLDIYLLDINLSTWNADQASTQYKLKSRKTYPEWNKTLMGPKSDEVGVELGGGNSGDFYKIYAKSQLEMAQDSKLGVKLTSDIVVSVIGKVDDTVLVANDLQNLLNLLLLSRNIVPSSTWSYVLRKLS